MVSMLNLPSYCLTSLELGHFTPATSAPVTRVHSEKLQRLGCKRSASAMSSVTQVPPAQGQPATI